MADSEQRGQGSSLGFCGGGVVACQLAAINRQTVTSTLLGVPPHTITSYRHLQGSQQRRKSGRERLHQAKSYRPYLRAAATSAATSASRGGPPTRDGLSEEIRKWQTLASVGEMCRKTRRKILVARQRQIGNLQRGLSATSGARATATATPAELVLLALEEKKFTIMREHLAHLISNFDVYDMAVQLTARVAEGTGGSCSGAARWPPPPGPSDSLFQVLIPNEWPSVTTVASSASSTSSASVSVSSSVRTATGVGADAAELWASSLPSRVMALFIATMQLVELAKEDYLGVDSDMEEAKEQGEGKEGRQRLAALTGRQLLDQAVVLLDALVRYCGGPSLLYSELELLAYLVYGTKDAFSDTETLLDAVGAVTSRTASSSSSAAAAAAPPPKAVLTSVAMLCRVARRIAVMASPPYLRRILHMGTMISFIKFIEDAPVSGDVASAAMEAVGRALGKASVRLRPFDSRRRVLDAIRTEAAEALEQRRQRTAASAPPGREHDSAGAALQSLLSSVLGTLPETVQSVWDAEGRRRAARAGGRDGEAAAGDDEDGDDVLKLHGAARDEQLPVRRRMARLLLDLAQGRRKTVVADGPGALSWILSAAAVLGRFNWVTSRTIAGCGTSGGAGGTAAAAAATGPDGAGDPEPRAAIAAATAAPLSSLDFGRSVGDFTTAGLGPVMLVDLKVSELRRRPQGAEGESSTEAAAAGGNNSHGISAATVPAVQLGLRQGSVDLWVPCTDVRQLGTQCTVWFQGDELENRASSRRFARELQWKLDEWHGAVLSPLQGAGGGGGGLDALLAVLAQVRTQFLDRGRDFVVVPVVEPLPAEQSCMDLLGPLEVRLRGAMVSRGGPPAGKTHGAEGEAAAAAAAAASRNGKAVYGDTPKVSISAAAPAPTTTTTAASTSPVVQLRPYWRQRRALVLNWALCCCTGLIGSDNLVTSRQRRELDGLMRRERTGEVADDGEVAGNPERVARERRRALLVEHCLGPVLDVRHLVSDRLIIVVLECRPGNETSG